MAQHQTQSHAQKRVTPLLILLTPIHLLYVTLKLTALIPP